MAKKKIEDKFKSLTEIEHVLERPGMYIGSIKNEPQLKYILDPKENKFVKQEITCNPGFLKLFDEIISNSVDEFKREDSLLDAIKVEVDQETGKISVYDNGGIPVEIHKTEKMYIPEMVFSKLRAGSNFNDDEVRTGVGTNGLGSVCTNIFSEKFIVETADGKNKFKQTYKNNMGKRSTPDISPSEKHFTKITYIPDYKRFEMDKLDDNNFKCIETRVYEVAGTNPKLNVSFNGTKIKIKSFKDYCSMFI